MSWVLLFIVGVAAGLVYSFETQHKTSQFSVAVVVWLGINAWLFSSFDILGTSFGTLLVIITLISVGVFVAMNFDTLHRIKDHYEKKLDYHASETARRTASHLMEEAETKLMHGRAKQQFAEVRQVLDSEREVRAAERKRDLAKAQRDAEYADIGRDATIQMRQHVIDLVKARKEEKMIGYLTRVVAAPREDDDGIESQPLKTDPLEKLVIWYNEGRARQTYLQSIAPDSVELKELEQALEPVHRTLAGAGRL